MKIDKEDLANKRLYYEDENGNVVPKDDDMSIPENAVYQISQFPTVLRQSYLDIESGNTVMVSEMGYSEDLVTAMVKSGDFTLSEAILVAARSCERCINSLAYQYGLDWGYPEKSEEWHKCGTECEFCEGEESNFEKPNLNLLMKSNENITTSSIRDREFLENFNKDVTSVVDIESQYNIDDLKDASTVEVVEALSYRLSLYYSEVSSEYAKDAMDENETIAKLLIYELVNTRGYSLSQIEYMLEHINMIVNITPERELKGNDDSLFDFCG